jgi:hypothetical protein
VIITIENVETGRAHCHLLASSARDGLKNEKKGWCPRGTHAYETSTFGYGFAGSENENSRQITGGKVKH